MAVIACHVRIAGHVQGVFFRAWAQQQAEQLNVAGWVRNRADGSVEVHVEGEEAAVAQILKQLRQGPPSGRVEDVRTWDVEPCDFDGFEVRH